MSMPRQARLDAPGTLHHVIGRGIEGIPWSWLIFRECRITQGRLERNKPEIFFKPQCLNDWLKKGNPQKVALCF
jgi:hypothetical protein